MVKTVNSKKWSTIRLYSSTIKTMNRILSSKITMTNRLELFHKAISAYKVYLLTGFSIQLCTLTDQSQFKTTKKSFCLFITTTRIVIINKTEISGTTSMSQTCQSTRGQMITSSICCFPVNLLNKLATVGSTPRQSNLMTTLRDSTSLC